MRTLVLVFLVALIPLSTLVMRYIRRYREVTDELERQCREKALEARRAQFVAMQNAELRKHEKKHRRIRRLLNPPPGRVPGR